MMTFNFDNNQLNKQAIDQLRDELSNNLREQESDELKQYATLRVMEQAAADAKSACTADAIQRAFSDHEQDASGGKTFEHDGLRFQVQRTPVYNFDQKRDWQTIHRRLEEAQKTLDAAKAAQKAVEKQLILNGKVEVTDVKVMLKFLPR